MPPPATSAPALEGRRRPRTSRKGPRAAAGRRPTSPRSPPPGARPPRRPRRVRPPLTRTRRRRGRTGGRTRSTTSGSPRSCRARSGSRGSPPATAARTSITRNSRLANGLDTVIVRGGVNIVTDVGQVRQIDISADSAVIWRRVDPKRPTASRSAPTARRSRTPRQPMEVYLEGNVVFRQDERKVAGNGDQKTYRAKQAYYDVRHRPVRRARSRARHVRPGPDRAGEGELAPDRPVPAARTRPPTATWVYGLQQIRADKTVIDRQPVPDPGLPVHQPVDRHHPDREHRRPNPNTGQAGRRQGRPATRPRT